MSVFTSKGQGPEPGHPEKGKRGIPNPSWVTICALPEHREVYQQVITGGVVTHELPMGKYAMSVVGCYTGRRARRQVRCHYVIEFVHDCTEEQWEVLQDLTPKNSSCVVTSKGTVFTCRFCKKASNARIEAAVHECAHLGIDPLSPDADSEMTDAVPNVPKGFVPERPPTGSPLASPLPPAPMPGNEPSAPPAPLTLEELPEK